MDNKTWFKQAKFGIMAHWGLYSILGGEWKGQRVKGYSEWIMHSFKIPVKEYEKLASVFNPIYFDAEEWIKLFKDAGARYFVFTAKHHEGFCLFRSQVDKYNVVDATPFKRDVVGELAEACYKHGLKFGLYYSQEIDWHEPDAVGKIRQPDENLKETVYWENNWDFPDIENKNYSRCFNDKIKPQVKELLTCYGDLCLMWFDTPGRINSEQSKELFDLVKRYQPDCLVNSRIGNGLGDYTTLADNGIPDKDFSAELAESPITLGSSWGYKSFDTGIKSADKIRGIRDFVNSRGVNCLLNVGPDALGRITYNDALTLKELGE